MRSLRWNGQKKKVRTKISLTETKGRILRRTWLMLRAFDIFVNFLVDPPAAK